MESKEKMIERLAASFGQSFEQVKVSIDKLKAAESTIKYAVQSMSELNKAAALLNIQKGKRRKPTNYTKPRNRKKKSKY